MALLSLLLPLAFLFPQGPPQDKGIQFQKPVLLRSEGKVIDVDIGHAAPLFVDLDGDGQRELLVGQFGEGKLRIYKREPGVKGVDFGPVRYLKVGDRLGRVPTG